jgi:hypothetical protein
LQYLYQPITGDVTIIARLTSVSNFSGNGKVGLMIRESMAPDSRLAMEVIFSDLRQIFGTRLGPLANIGASFGSSFSVPVWLKLVRSGNNFTGYASSDGTNWSTIIGPQVVSLDSTAYIGFAVTSEDGTFVTTATFDSLTITQP